ncbi:cyclin-P3-1 [Juglans microcarpa x Juglans regia]|uniref:cyclin-P3-1 n=1 Tax=Juglans microcarpa x Juglans regia TaxID=2249226 RepID=UPI001B7F0853|nr:cyclin-P3-1 [Juglans microcarpa x Juglans regia]
MAFKSKAVESDEEIYASLGLEVDEYDQKGPSGIPRVILVVSSVLQRIIYRNEKSLKVSKKKDTVTIFHGLRAPNLSIQQYIERIFKYSSCSPSCFVYIYLERFTLRTNAYLTTLNAHRLLITTIMVAAKFMDDDCYDNAYYAKVGGVSTAEMNRLEMKFLFTIDFRLHVTTEDFRKYSLQLQKEGLGDY